MKIKYNIIGELKDIKEKCKVYNNQSKLSNIPLEKGYHRKITTFSENSKTKPQYNGKSIDYVLFDKPDNKLSKESVLRFFKSEDNEIYQILVRKRDRDGDRKFQKNGKTRLNKIV
ncbi:MAG: hypothetical protein ACOC3Z_01015 [Nanoarchaeota archaeon]